MDEQEIPFAGVAEPMVEAAPRIGDVPRAARGFRSGPLAAAVATVVIVAATAVPGKASFKSPSAAPAAVLASYEVDEVPTLEDLGSLQLGGVFEGFTLLGSSCSWDDRADGTSTLRVRLSSPADPGTFLFGDLTLRGRITSAELNDLSRELFAGVASSVSGAVEGPGGWLGAAKASPGVDAYTSLAGTLQGAGDLEGASIAVRNIPGTAVRRGPWTSRREGETATHEDTVFARVIWLRETGGDRVEIEPEGAGTLSLYLTGASGAE